MAAENFIKGGTNRVILATDGDFNVGITDQADLIQPDRRRRPRPACSSPSSASAWATSRTTRWRSSPTRATATTPTSTRLEEARKVLVEEMAATLVTIAKDVKIQVEFNPAKVGALPADRLREPHAAQRGLQQRQEGRRRDRRRAHVTALYELVPATKLNRDAKESTPATTPPTTQPTVDPLKYQSHQVIKSDDLLTLKLRYKQPDGDTSSKIEIPATDSGLTYGKASEDFKFAAAVAQFGMILRGSAEKGTATLDGVIELADEGKGKDEKGYLADFVELAKKAKALIK